MTMIERYGENALGEIEQRILELEERGQRDALQLWREIRKRVELLMVNQDNSTRH